MPDEDTAAALTNHLLDLRRVASRPILPTRGKGVGWEEDPADLRWGYLGRYEANTFACLHVSE
eukprot:scaffold6961_cov42-Phaeocystis_antarctica.AAC.3